LLADGCLPEQRRQDLAILVRETWEQLVPELITGHVAGLAVATLGDLLCPAEAMSSLEAIYARIEAINHDEFFNTGFLLRDIIGDPHRPYSWQPDMPRTGIPRISPTRAYVGGSIRPNLLPSQRPLSRIMPGEPYTCSRKILSWQDATILKIARHIYEDNDWAALPVLADALEEAGLPQGTPGVPCGDAVEHCRGRKRCPRCLNDAQAVEDCQQCQAQGWIRDEGFTGCPDAFPAGPHARGCWVVDFVLDK
jgi:hypothetical protein